MVLPDEIADAALDGDVYTVRRFLAQHPERVNDVVLGATRSLEYVIEFYLNDGSLLKYTGDAPHLNDTLELAKAVRAAQSTSTSTRLTPWQKYCLVPPKELLRLRSQIARGKVVATRSTPPHLARLFSRSLPNEIAWRVLAFWNPRY